METAKAGKASSENKGRDMSEELVEETRALDFLELDALLTEEEREVRDDIRRFVRERLKPNIREWWEHAIFPREIVPEMGERGLLGMHLKGYGCAGKSAVEYGLSCAELEAGDSGLRTFVSVQGSLTMSAIHKFGSEEQKQEWLPRMARGEAIGCFGLTEPEAGSDPASMRTSARRDGTDWILTRSKQWVTHGTVAEVAIVWARTDDGVRGFLVPTSTPGFEAKEVSGKLSLRASLTAELHLH